MAKQSLLVVSIMEKSCTGCGECIYACPYGALHLNRFTRTAYLLQGLCQGCGQCVTSCPYMALYMVRQQTPDELPPAI